MLRAGVERNVGAAGASYYPLSFDSRMAFSASDYANMHLLLGECHGNASAAARLYHQRYGTHVDRRVAQGVDDRLRQTGNILPNPGSSGGRQHSTAYEVEDDVLDAVYQEPTTSTRRLANQFHLSQHKVRGQHSF
jgi:hypothetical protein